MNTLESATNPSIEPLVRSTGIETGETKPEHGIALCLSGGGYRAMLFHVGALWRLNEFGLFEKLDRVSSVSGGSITAAVLGLNWTRLDFQDGVARGFAKAVVDPIRVLADQTIDLHAVGWGILSPLKSISDEIAGYYRKYLFCDATLQNLPDRPRFVINATNVKSGALWRFSKPYMADYRVGMVKNPTVPLAVAVAASSAFPPFLSPAHLPLDPLQFAPEIPGELNGNEYRSEAVLTDGGVYDNLGLEPAWKRYDTILVSDGGRSMAPEAQPADDWAQHSYRIIDMLQYQILCLRRRQVMDSLESNIRAGAYWGIQTDIAKYEVGGSLSCPHARTLELADTPTRLAQMPADLQERLINWGYAVCDAAMRRYFPPSFSPPPAFPYPTTGV